MILFFNIAKKGLLTCYVINMLLTLLKNGVEAPMLINVLITRLGIISPTLDREFQNAVFQKIVATN